MGTTKFGQDDLGTSFEIDNLNYFSLAVGVNYCFKVDLSGDEIEIRSHPSNQHRISGKTRASGLLFLSLSGRLPAPKQQ